MTDTYEFRRAVDNRIKGFRYSGRMQQAEGAQVTAASTLVLGGGGNSFIVNGTTTIDRIETDGWQVGSVINLYFQDAAALSNQAGSVGTAAQMILLGLAAATGIQYSTFSFVYMDGVWIETGERRAYSQRVLPVIGRLQEVDGGGVTAANDMTLGDGNAFSIIGATQINRIDNTGWQQGSVVSFLFVNNPVVKHGIASGGTMTRIMLHNNVDWNPGNGSTLTLRLIASVWWEIGRKV